MRRGRGNGVDAGLRKRAIHASEARGWIKEQSIGQRSYLSSSVGTLRTEFWVISGFSVPLVCVVNFLLPPNDDTYIDQQGSVADGGRKGI